MAGDDIRGGLFPHNAEALEAVEARLRQTGRTCALNTCGTGKQFVAKALVAGHPEWRCLWVTNNWLVAEAQDEEFTLDNSVEATPL